MTDKKMAEANKECQSCMLMPATWSPGAVIKRYTKGWALHLHKAVCPGAPREGKRALHQSANVLAAAGRGCKGY
jgi:hypothetical protein